MAMLSNLSVEKVSFVGSPANKRKYLLLKSKDASVNEPSRGEKTVRDELKKALSAIIKTEKDPDKVLSSLKADKDLKITDAEVETVKSTLELQATLEPQRSAVEPSVKSDPAESAIAKRLEDLEKRLADKESQLIKAEEASRKREIRDWLVKSCPYAPGNADEVVEDIFAVEKSDKERAKRMMASLEQASLAIENSKLFGETGINSQDNPLTVEGELLRTMNKSLEGVHKGEDKRAEARVLEESMRQFSPRKYMQYRQEHILRAKTQTAQI